MFSGINPRVLVASFSTSKSLNDYNDGNSNEQKEPSFAESFRNIKHDDATSKVFERNVVGVELVYSVETSVIWYFCQHSVCAEISKNS